MGAIRTVPRFQTGGIMPDDSMLFPPLVQGQVTPPAPPTAEPAPAPVPAAPQQQARALNINPNYPQGNAPVTEMPTDVNIELDKARREDELAIHPTKGQLLSHTGDENFLTQKPAPSDYREDPEYQRLQLAREYIQQNGSGQKPTDIARAIRMVDAQEKALTKRYENEYKAKQSEWKKNETTELQRVEGDKLRSGGDLENQWNLIGDHYKTHVDTLKTQTGAQGDINRAADPSTYLSASEYKENLLRLGQLNNLPLERANETFRHLAGPNGSFNGRKGAAAANYKVLGRDVGGNVWLDTANGKVRVSNSTFDAINQSRVKAYKALQEYEKKQRSAAPPMSIGQRVKKGMGLE